MGPGMARILRAAVAPMRDEVALLARARAEVAGWEGRLPDGEMLRRLTQAQGVEFATACFYASILAAPDHGAFVRAIDAQPQMPLPGRSRLHLLIVPALYYQELPEYGGDGAAVAEMARASGLEVTVAPLDSKGTLAGNAAILWETLAACAGETIVLFSLSVGGGEVRLMLDKHAGDPRLDRLAGWINVCGLVRGIPLAARLLRNPLRRWHVAAMCKVIGLDFGIVRELDPANPAWQGDPTLPPGLPVVNLIGVPLHSHVQQRSLFKRYGWMQELGPNDGMALLPDLLVLPGLIYPLWGADHYFRTPQVSRLLYQLFRYLRLTWAGEDTAPVPVSGARSDKDG